jgi:glutamate 5-kinase
MQSEKKYKRIVIKIGSSLFCSVDNTLDLGLVAGLAEQIAFLLKEGKEVCIVASGAIALGMRALGFKEKPRELHNLQAAAAVGQNGLMDVYCGAFKTRGYRGAQILLTWEDFNDRTRYLNAKNTILALLKYGVVPVINENDTVSTDEIRFGDNDQLSARVAGLVSADILIILSDVDGLLDGDKALVRLVDAITPQIRALACPTNKKTCVGGMITKIDAAKIAVDSGIPCVIANGRRKDILVSVINDAYRSGTLFLPKKGLTERDRWIAFGTKPKGKITVDEGAKKALLNHKSLLPVGIVRIEGVFDRSDVVSIIDCHGNEFARGKVDFSARHLEKVRGIRREKEVMHCDNIVLV